MDDLISRKALLAEYDRVHIGEPGKARKLIEEAPAVQEWISVKDRLPEVGQLCLCYKERKGMTGYQMGTFLGAVFSENCAAFKSISHYGCVGATHWMPLPDPPKGE